MNYYSTRLLELQSWLHLELISKGEEASGVHDHGKVNSKCISPEKWRLKMPHLQFLGYLLFLISVQGLSVKNPQKELISCFTLRFHSESFSYLFQDGQDASVLKQEFMNKFSKISLWIIDQTFNQDTVLCSENYSKDKHHVVHLLFYLVPDW